MGVVVMSKRVGVMKIGRWSLLKWSRGMVWEKKKNFEEKRYFLGEEMRVCGGKNGEMKGLVGVENKVKRWGEREKKRVRRWGRKGGKIRRKDKGGKRRGEGGGRGRRKGRRKGGKKKRKEKKKDGRNKKKLFHG